MLGLYWSYGVFYQLSAARAANEAGWRGSDQSLRRILFICSPGKNFSGENWQQFSKALSHLLAGGHLDIEPGPVNPALQLSSTCNFVPPVNIEKLASYSK